MAMRIEDYGLIGDLQTAALVGKDGSIDWLCLPRFDSPACFAALLADESAGHWALRPQGAGPCTTRRYRGDSLVLETEWDTDSGAVRVIDCMTPGDEEVDVVRIVEGVEGRVSMEMVLRLRFDYGSVVPWVRRTDGQLAAIAGPDAAWLTTDVPLHGEDFATRSTFDVTAGQRVPFVLTYRPSHEPTPAVIDAERAVAATESFWQDWMSDFRYEGAWSQAVRRSLITLKALTYAPTGGVVAAATTSLPEQLGGCRNWDYRFCWLRDAAFTLQALLGTGFIIEARAWREWLLRAVAGDPSKLQMIYGIDGSRRLTEYTADWLPGYEGSTPVRIGNNAASQLQLDVWGAVLDALHYSRENGMEADIDAWKLQRALLDYLEGNWSQPDNWLWEVRAERRHFVHSKVMAWVGLDRAIRAVERFGLPGPADQWRTTRDQIHTEVCREGYDSDRNTFTQFYGSHGLDAALLQIPRVGFLPWDDPRVAGTVEAIQRELRADGFLLRYQTQADGNVDGLPGEEGSFILCTFWLVDALAGLGREREAIVLFERLLGLRNNLGLLSEEWSPRLSRHLGNTPQAFSHVGLVNSARHLSSGPSATSTAATIRSVPRATP